MNELEGLSRVPPRTGLLITSTLNSLTVPTSLRTESAQEAGELTATAVKQWVSPLS